MSSGRAPFLDPSNVNNLFSISVPQAKRAYHSLGLHIGFVTIALSLAYVIVALFVIVDIVALGNTSYHLFANIPIFSLTMVTCHWVTKISKRFPNTERLNRSIMHRLCLTTLEYVVVIDLASIDFKKVADLPGYPHLLAFFLVIIAILSWNLFCVFVLAKHLCPNHWFMRGLAEGAQALGLTWTGLLVLKVRIKEACDGGRGSWRDTKERLGLGTMWW